MRTQRIGVSALHVLGDLRLGEDLVVDGWCWCPDRPRARLVPDLLVNGRVVGRVRADAFRRDLRDAGIGDGGHGFAASIPATAFDAAMPAIVSARAGRSRVTFGQVRRDPPARGLAACTTLEAAVAARSDDLARAVREAQPEGGWAARLSRVSAELARVLHARAACHHPLAAGRALLVAAADGLALDYPPASRLAIVVPSVRSAEVALGALRAVACAAASLRARVVLLDAGADARVPLLASVLPELILLPAPQEDTWAAAVTAALPHVDADWLVLARPGATMSGVALGRLLDTLDAREAVVGVEAGLAPVVREVVATVAPVGIAVAARRAAALAAASAGLLAGADALFAEPWAAPA